jgi:UDPglucose 6-dehydrogenase
MTGLTREQANIMTNSLRMGVIGHGFVGSSVSFGFDNDYTKQLIIDPRIGNFDYDDLIMFNPQITFVCVPTPPDADGNQDNTIIESVFAELARLRYKGVVVLKSTVQPGNIKAMFSKFKDLNIVYNPEFLTEANAKNDFVNPPFQILGGSWEDTTIVERAYNNYSNVKVCATYKVDPVTASLLKYTINSFLAMKVTFFNELNAVFENAGTSDTWNTFTDILAQEPRMGTSHMKVPGPDGKRGFGGNCFPKDTSAFVNYSKELDGDYVLNLLESAVNINKSMRGVDK